MPLIYLDLFAHGRNGWKINQTRERYMGRSNKRLICRDAWNDIDRGEPPVCIDKTQKKPPKFDQKRTAEYIARHVLLLLASPWLLDLHFH